MAALDRDLRKHWILYGDTGINSRAQSLFGFCGGGRSRNGRGCRRSGPIHNPCALVAQRVLKIGRVEDERPRGGAQAVDRLVRQSEGGRQLVKVVALGLFLQRLE
jgi:hypothetical protein